jgi:ribosomal protein L10
VACQPDILLYFLGPPAVLLARGTLAEIARLEKDNYKMTPGTTSELLWHFTGGPLFDEITKKQTKELKSEEKAFKALKGILQSNCIIRPEVTT